MVSAPDPLLIRQLSALPDDILLLESAAVAEGFRFLTRLVTEWESGANRFDRHGEAFFAAFSHGRLLAIGGLTHDPYAGPQVGRLRRVYVAPASRGVQVGRVLVQHLVQHASGYFNVVRLSTDTPAAAAFYLRCGFQQIEDDGATHVKVLGEAR